MTSITTNAKPYRVTRTGSKRQPRPAIFAILAASLCLCVSPARLFADPLMNSELQFNFGTLGNVDVDLFNNVTPATVNNFLSYVTSGALNGMIVHRNPSSSPQAPVIQGGGYTYSDQTGFAQIPTSPGIGLDYTLPNTLGTIGMASTNDPDSETSQWFINTADNSTGFDPKYAVFGQVVSGMDVVNKIAALGIDSDGVPLLNTSLPVSLSNLVVASSVTELPAHPAYENPTNRLAVLAEATVTAADATAVISDLVKNGIYTVSDQPLTTTFQYVDTNGDGLVDPLDALQVINFLNDPTPSMAAVPAGLSFPSVSSTALVPEPASGTLLAAGAGWCSSAGGSGSRLRRHAAV